MGIIDKLNPYSEGIVPNTLKYLFNFTEENSSKFSKYRIHLSLYQVYLDNVHDLLNPEGKPLVIREDKNDVYIEDLIEVHVKTINQAVNIINAGLNFRKLGGQGMNDTSSRSHTLLNIDIYQNMVNNDHIQSVSSRLTLVDLAGSERVRKTKASGSRLKEAQSINSSLSALGNVILGLTKGEYVTFRQSKLTRILQNSLKGDSKIVLLATVGSTFEDTNETLSTLLFANRCKQVLTNPEDKISIRTTYEDPTASHERITELQHHYKKREEELMSHIMSLERKISHTSYSQVNNANTYSEQQSPYTPERSVRQTFDIEEIVQAHPQAETKKLKASIKKQQNYIDFLKHLLLETLDEISEGFTNITGYSEMPKMFENKIISALHDYQTRLDRDEILEEEPEEYVKSSDPESEFITKSNNDIIQRLANLEKVHTIQFKCKTDYRFVKDMVEDFSLRANSNNEEFYPLEQINIMKHYQER